MKNKLLIYYFRKIKSNYKRFISLLLMALLGVGFFTGIKATSPLIIQTLDKFLDKHKVYDLELVSNLGFSDNDIKILEEIDDISVYGSYQLDTYAKINKEDYLIRVLNIDNGVNELYLEKGRMPKNDNEIVVDSKLLEVNDVHLGDIIEIADTNLENDKFKIVGSAISPIYYSMDRGNTNIGNGKIDYFIYANKKVISKDYYSYLYILENSLNKEVTNSSKYLDKIDDLRKKVENKSKFLSTDRLKELGLDRDFVNVKINERTDNSSYKDIIDASSSIKQIGNVFPLVFYVIAVFISLITVMRMTQEDRLENGTMKALGYNTFQIVIKYLLFSFSATIIGSIIGIIIGCSLIPNVIWNIYQLLFRIPYFKSNINILYATIGTIIALICVCGSSVLSCINNLREVPASLMRPKAPKNGKRVLLERINFIWKRLSFSKKITIRNIFRYKSRVLATIIGISGCSALILAGFGLRDAVSDIVVYQYNKVFHYDRMIALNSNYSKAEITDYFSKLKDIKDYEEIRLEDVEVGYAGRLCDVKLISTDDYKRLDKVISLYKSNSSKKVVPKNGEIVVSEKLKVTLGIKKGDFLVIYDHNNKKHKLKVADIIENYVDIYVYINEDTYENIFGKLNYNTYLINYKENISKKESNKLDEKIINNKNVLGLFNTEEMVDLVNKTMKSLDSVVVILILAAAMLSFIVLYNLSNINISERQREIATLKVLGFYNKEVDDYITKENILLTLIGIIIGLILGKYLSNYLIFTCEPENVMFVRNVKFLSYIYSIIITVLFTIIVNIITHFSLKKIKMIESLKNVE